MEASLEQTLQHGKLLREVNALIVAHLRDNNLYQAATAVASATMTPLNTEGPPNKLLELVAKRREMRLQGEFLLVASLTLLLVCLQDMAQHLFLPIP